jgi:hypothetical protein
MHNKNKHVIYTMEDLIEFFRLYRSKKGMKLKLKDLIFQNPQKNKNIKRG